MRAAVAASRSEPAQVTVPQGRPSGGGSGRVAAPRLLSLGAGRPHARGLPRTTGPRRRGTSRGRSAQRQAWTAGGAAGRLGHREKPPRGHRGESQASGSRGAPGRPRPETGERALPAPAARASGPLGHAGARLLV